MKTNGAIITNAGKELISFALANNKSLNFTRFKIGKGDISTIEEAKELIDLVSFYKEIPITSIAQNNSGIIRARCSFTNESFPVEVILKEIGLYATVEGKSEILFGYVNDGSGESFPPGSSGNIVERVRDIYLGISTTVNVTATIDKRVVYATIYDLEEEINKCAKKITRINPRKGLQGGGNLSSDIDIDIKTTDTSIQFTESEGLKLKKTSSWLNDASSLFTSKGALNLFNDLTGKINSGIESCKNTLRSEMITIKNNLTSLIGSKEDKFSKNSGFNLNKSDVVSNNSNEVFTPKGALNLKNWLVTNYTTLMNNIRDSLDTKINTKENAFSKKTGFNLDKTDSISSTSSILLATAKAVKTAYDKAVEAYNKATSNLSKLESLETNKQNKQDNGLLTRAKFIVGAINSLFLEKASLEHLKEYGIGDLIGGVKKKEGGQYTANECIDFGVYANENGDASQGGFGGQAVIFNTCFSRDYYGFQLANIINNQEKFFFRTRSDAGVYSKWVNIYTTPLINKEIKPFLVMSELVIATDGRKWLKEVYDNFERYSIKRGDLNIQSSAIHSPVQVEDLANVYGMIASNDNTYGTKAYFLSSNRINVYNEGLAVTMISFNLWKGGA